MVPVCIDRIFFGSLVQAVCSGIENMAMGAGNGAPAEPAHCLAINNGINGVGHGLSQSEDNSPDDEIKAPPMMVSDLEYNPWTLQGLSKLRRNRQFCDVVLQVILIYRFNMQALFIVEGYVCIIILWTGLSSIVRVFFRWCFIHSYKSCLNGTSWWCTRFVLTRIFLFNDDFLVSSLPNDSR